MLWPPGNLFTHGFEQFSHKQKSILDESWENPNLRAKIFDSSSSFNLSAGILWYYLHRILDKLSSKFCNFWSWFESVWIFFEKVHYSLFIPHRSDLVVWYFLLVIFKEIFWGALLYVGVNILFKSRNLWRPFDYVFFFSLQKLCMSYSYTGQVWYAYRTSPVCTLFLSFSLVLAHFASASS